MHIKDYLNLKVEQYNNLSFIEDDPIKIPHLFKKKEDIEISGFLTSSIAWGNRKSIISNSKKMMQLLDNDPYNFVFNHSEKDLKNLWDKSVWNKRHLQIIYFGREYCPARNHDLSECIICSWAATKKRIQKESKN